MVIVKMRSLALALVATSGFLLQAPASAQFAGYNPQYPFAPSQGDPGTPNLQWLGGDGGSMALLPDGQTWFTAFGDTYLWFAGADQSQPGEFPGQEHRRARVAATRPQRPAVQPLLLPSGPVDRHRHPRPGVLRRPDQFQPLEPVRLTLLGRQGLRRVEFGLPLRLPRPSHQPPERSGPDDAVGHRPGQESPRRRPGVPDRLPDLQPQPQPHLHDRSDPGQ